MAYSGTVPAWDKKLEQGIAHWRTEGSALITAMLSMMNTHTHGGTPDGTAIPLANLPTLTTLTIPQVARTQSQVSILVDTAHDTTFTVPVFQAPTGTKAVITAINLITEANLVGQGTNYLTLTAVNKGTAGAGTPVVATLTMNAAGGTAVAYASKSMGAITNGTLSANEVLVISKGTQGTGLQLPASRVAIHYYTIDA